MCIAEVQRDFTKCTGFRNIKSLRIQFLNFHTHSFLKRISLRTQVKTFFFSHPWICSYSSIVWWCKVGFHISYSLDLLFLKAQEREAWLPEVGDTIYRGWRKLEPQCLLHPLRLYEHHECEELFPTTCFPQWYWSLSQDRTQESRQLIGLSLWNYEPSKSVLVLCKLWYFCHRDLEQYTDTIYSTDTNRKKRHRDQNEANASKFPNLESFWRWNQVLWWGIYCQPDGFRNAQETALGLSAWVFLESFNWIGKTYAEDGQHHSIGCSSRLNMKDKVRRLAFTLVLSSRLELQCGHHSRLLTPHPPCHKWSQKQQQKSNQERGFLIVCFQNSWRNW